MWTNNEKLVIGELLGGDEFWRDGKYFTISLSILKKKKEKKISWKRL